MTTFTYEGAIMAAYPDDTYYPPAVYLDDKNLAELLETDLGLDYVDTIARADHAQGVDSYYGGKKVRLTIEVLS
jgi:hypothetical protein